MPILKIRTFLDINGREAPPPSIDLADLSPKLSQLPQKRIEEIARIAGGNLKEGGITYNKAIENRLEGDKRLQEALANLMSQYGLRPIQFGTMSRDEQKRLLNEANEMLSGPGGSFFKGTSVTTIDFGLLAINTTTVGPIVRPRAVPVGVIRQPIQPVVHPINNNSNTAVNGGINRVGPGGFQRGAYASGPGASNNVGTIGGD